MPELHLSGYNNCGRFTKRDKRLARCDELVNKLNAGCKQHDIFYRDHKDTKERHVAYMELANLANEIIHVSDASIGEKINSELFKAAMIRKIAFGMVIKY